MHLHEERCFLDKLSRFQGDVGLHCFNLVTKAPEAQQLWRDYDVVLVGGSGRYGAVSNENPWFVTFLQTLRDIAESETPMLCSCFGHQALARALGGTVITDRPNAELGTHEIQLTEAGTEDPLYDGFPSSFRAQLGHNDRVTQLPEGAVNLASTGPCPVQSYKLDGKLVYATQFHPEMSHQENQERAMGYLQVYDVEQTTPDRLAEMFRPSDEASGLVARFLQLASGDIGLAAGEAAVT